MDDWQTSVLAACADVDGASLDEAMFAAGGPAVWVGRREVAHFDAERTLDIRLTRHVIRARHGELGGDPRVALRRNASDWVEVTMATDGDVAWAQALVREAVQANRATAPPGPAPTGAELDRRRRVH